MDSTSPTYHPTFAKDYLQVYNNLNQNGTYIWYDTENPENISYPSDFTLKKTSNWTSALNLRLNSVTLNSSSSLNSHTAFPTAEGGFNATLKKEGSSAPTVDLYFRGNIAKSNISVNARYDYDVPTPSIASMGTPHFEFNSGGEFGTNQNVVVSWGRVSSNPTFSPATFTSGGSKYYYRYTGDKISFTTNWNNENKYSNIAAPSSSQYLTFTKPNIDSITNIPTVYCNWEIIWDYPCSCNTDCGCYSDCGCYNDSGYIQWTATYNSSYYIRTGPGTNYDVASFTIQSNTVTVVGESGDWYHCQFITTTGTQYGWVNKAGISGSDPNQGCNSDYCSCDGIYDPSCPSWYDPCPSDFYCPSFDDSCDGYWSCSYYDWYN